MLNSWTTGAVLGFACGLAGAVSSSVGMALIKSSSTHHETGRMMGRRRWVAGTSILVLFNPLMDCVAYAMAPLLLISPLSGVSLITATLLARLGFSGLREVPRMTHWVLVVSIACGVGLAAATGPHSSGGAGVDLKKVDGRLGRPGALIWLAASTFGLVLVSLIYGTHRFGPARRKTLRFVCFLTAVAAGVAGAHTAMCLKLLMSSLTQFLGGVRNIDEFFKVISHSCAIVALVGIAPFAGTQLWLLNAAVSNSPLSISAPCYLAFFSILTMLDGILIFDEAHSMNRSHGIAFTSGATTATVATLILGTLRAERDSPLAATDAASTATTTTTANEACAAPPPWAALAPEPVNDQNL